MAAQTGLLIRYKSLVFDLSGMHSADLLTRVGAALLVGLDRVQSSPRLQALLTTLTALSSRNPVRFFTNAKEWLPGPDLGWTRTLSRFGRLGRPADDEWLW